MTHAIHNVLLDCDDVLLDWIGGFRDWCSDKLGREIVGLPDDWHIETWLGVTEEVCVELIREHNASEHFGQLKAVEGAKAVLDKWRENPFVRLHVITSCSSGADTVQMRRGNLEREFGDIFDSIHCLDLTESKKKVLQAFKPGAMWIEDNYKNCLLGVECGHRGIMRERPHNRQFMELQGTDGVQWFSDWEQFLG